MPILAPSILAADFARLGEQCADVLEAGAEWLHIDVMDGHFVPNITYGPPVLKSLKPLKERTGCTIDVHLMIEHPERFIDDFVAAGADIITVHVEACPHLHRIIQQIREAGVRPGVTLNPATPLVTLDDILPDVDLVLVMSVNPGFGGQSYIPGSTARIARLRQMLDACGSRAHLEVDGGVTPANVSEVVRAGADVIVAGSAVFKGGSIRDNVTAIKEGWTKMASGRRV